MARGAEEHSGRARRCPRTPRSRKPPWRRRQCLSVPGRARMSRHPPPLSRPRGTRLPGQPRRLRHFWEQPQHGRAPQIPPRRHRTRAPTEKPRPPAASDWLAGFEWQRHLRGRARHVVEGGQPAPPCPCPPGSSGAVTESQRLEKSSSVDSKL